MWREWRIVLGLDAPAGLERRGSQDSIAVHGDQHERHCSAGGHVAERTLVAPPPLVVPGELPVGADDDLPDLVVLGGARGPDRSPAGDLGLGQGSGFGGMGGGGSLRRSWR